MFEEIPLSNSSESVYYAYNIYQTGTNEIVTLWERTISDFEGYADGVTLNFTDNSINRGFHIGSVGYYRGDISSLSGEFVNNSVFIGGLDVIDSSSAAFMGYHFDTKGAQIGNYFYQTENVLRACNARIMLDSSSSQNIGYIFKRSPDPEISGRLYDLNFNPIGTRQTLVSGECLRATSCSATDTTPITLNPISPGIGLLDYHTYHDTLSEEYIRYKFVSIESGGATPGINPLTSPVTLLSTQDGVGNIGVHTTHLIDPNRAILLFESSSKAYALPLQINGTSLSVERAGNITYLGEPYTYQTFSNTPHQYIAHGPKNKDGRVPIWSIWKTELDQTLSGINYFLTEENQIELGSRFNPPHYGNPTTYQYQSAAITYLGEDESGHGKGVYLSYIRKNSEGIRAAFAQRSSIEGVKNSQRITNGDDLIVGEHEDDPFSLYGRSPWGDPVGFNVTKLEHGKFYNCNDLDKGSITHFTNENIANRGVCFKHDGSNHSPSIKINVKSGTGTSLSLSNNSDFTPRRAAPAIALGLIGGAFGVIGSLFMGAMALMLVVYFVKKRMKDKREGEEIDLDHMIAPTSEELNRLIDFSRKEFEELLTDYSELKVIKHLGGGGQASVFLVEHQGKEMVYKIFRNIDIDGFKSFTREIKALLDLRNPYIIPMYNVTLEPNRIGYTMEKADCTLLDYWSNLKQGDEGQLSGILLGILYGLKHLHSKGLVHRDLKPENILIKFEDGKPVPKLADFGLTRKVQEKGQYVTQQVGTPAYMPPESLEGVYSSKSDLYSFGGILFFLLTKKELYQENKDPQIVFKRSVQGENKLKKPKLNLSDGKLLFFKKRDGARNGGGKILASQSFFRSHEIKEEFRGEKAAPLFFQIYKSCLSVKEEKRPDLDEVISKIEENKGAINDFVQSHLRH